MSEWNPATDVEVALREALAASDQEQYFRVLSRTELLLPVSTEALAGRAPMGWGTWTTGNRTHVLAFTSPASLQACLNEPGGFSVQGLSYDGRYVGVNFRNTDPGRVKTVARVVDMTTGREVTLPVPAGQGLRNLQFLPDGGMVMQTTNRLVRFDRANAVVAQVTLPAGIGLLLRYVP